MRFSCLVRLGAFVLVLVLSGCGGSSSGGGGDADVIEPVVLPKAQTGQSRGTNLLSIVSNPVRVRPDGDGSYFTYVLATPSGGLSVRNYLNTEPAIIEPEGFTAFKTQSNLTDNGGRTVRGITPSGGGVGIATTYVDTLGDALSIFIDRNFETTLPVSGSVDYSGGYMAVYRFSDTLQPAGHITGKAALTVDFDTLEVDGTIFDRANTGSGTLAPINLEISTLEDGLFRGVTNGGFFNGGGTSTLPGNYGGLITGSGGEEVVGGVTLTHRANGGDRFDEAGIFMTYQVSTSGN